MFCWRLDQGLLRAVKGTPRSQLYVGYGANSGPSRGDPWRRAFRPFHRFRDRRSEGRTRPKPVFKGRLYERAV